MGKPPREHDDEAIWDRIALSIDRLIHAWETHATEGADCSAEPDISRFASEFTGEHHMLALCELIKVDLEHRWRANCSPKKMEHYFEQFPALKEDGGHTASLIFEEVQVRLQAGDLVSQGEIERRFPERAAECANLLGSIALPGSPNETFSQSDVLLADPDARPSHLQTTIARPAPESNRSSRDREVEAREELDSLTAGMSIDDFDLLVPLGQGAFARVFLARQRSMERLVALKVSIDASSEPQTLAQMDHPNIVHVFDQRTWGRASLRLLYMEIVAGGTLHDVIRNIAKTSADKWTGEMILAAVDARLAESGVAPPEGSRMRRSIAESNWPDAVCHIASRVAEGLAYAHAHGVLHRDIKPANILLSPEGSPKIADFNISFNASREVESAGDNFGGSLAYMSPEQLAACHPLLEGSPQCVREASDIYSLGVVVCELLLGHRPFDDSGTRRNVAAGIQRMVDRRNEMTCAELDSVLGEAVPVPLKQVLARALAPEPNDRFRAAGQMAAAFRLCLHPRGWKLLSAPTGWFGKAVIAHPVWMVILATLLPNIVVAVLNYLYNKSTILPLLPPAGLETFLKTKTIVNGVAFPIGVIVGAIGVYRATRVLFSRDGARPNNGRRILFLGRFMAWIDVALWCVAGLAYSLTLHLDAPADQLVFLYAHFLTSLSLCGLLAATYPFFFVTFMAVRWMAPKLFRDEIAEAPTLSDYFDLQRLMRTFLVVAAAVPLIAIFLTLLQYDQHKTFLMIFSVSGLGFIGLYYLLYRPIEDDLAALVQLSAGTPE